MRCPPGLAGSGRRAAAALAIASAATGLGWALAVGRIGAIAGPTYGALLVSFGGGVPAAAMAFAAPALVGAALMLALRSKTTQQAPVASDAELVA